MKAGRLAALGARLRRGWDRLAAYLPVALMALLALATYLLVRHTPVFGPAAPPRPVTHEPDYFLKNFSTRSYDPTGRLKSEVFGAEGRHYPDTDTLEIDQPRIRGFHPRGDTTVATARRAMANGDASEVQLTGDAVVVREAGRDPGGKPRPRVEIRSEFLHLFADTEQVRTHKPVTLQRGGDRFSGDALEFDNLQQSIVLRGRVRGSLMPGPAALGEGGATPAAAASTAAPGTPQAPAAKSAKEAKAVKATKTAPRAKAPTKASTKNAAKPKPKPKPKPKAGSAAPAGKAATSS